MTMKSARLILVATTAAFWLATAVAFGQNKPAPGPYDGKWVGESAKCSPARNYTFGGITVANSSFSWSALDGGVKATCRVSINPDGSFESPKECAFQLKGKFEAKKVTISIKTSERICDIVANHE
jgi:hypothetical protein